MYRPLRKQACSHRFCGWATDSVNVLTPRGSELAREGNVFGKADVLDVPAPSQASLLPQILGRPTGSAYPRTRGSELAREGCVSDKADVLNVPAPSQASLLPQVLGWPTDSVNVLNPVGASLLAKTVFQAQRKSAECTGLFASKLAPTDFGG